MHIRLIAVGERQPDWVGDGFESYVERFPREWKFRLDAVPAQRRTKNDNVQTATQAEGERILGHIRGDEQVVLLDERGREFTSSELSQRLAKWLADGRDLCFVIGGADGVSQACHDRADFVWSLSNLTLPHGLARVLFAEQMYRAWSLQVGHPYHRE